MKKVYYDIETAKWKEILSVEIRNGIFSNIKSKDINDFEEVEEYILPGFIDAHIHILEDPYQITSSKDTLKETFELLWERAVINLNEALDSGVTTVKDLGGRFFISINIRDMIEKSNLDFPNFVTSGCYFSRNGGHCDNRGAILINSTTEFYNHLQHLKDNNIEFVKILNDKQVFPDAELKSMVDSAHKFGMIVSIHAFHNDTALSAVKAGVDILEHAADFSDELLEIIEARGVIVVPTYVSAYDGCFTSCEDLDCDISDNLLKEWYESECKVINKLFDRNIKVALGSDGGFLGTPCNSVIREIRLLHEHFNISIEKLMKSANIITPQTIRRDNQIGLIKNGYFADYICYEKNPLLDLGQLDTPKKVFLKGKEIKREKTQYRLLSQEDAIQLMDYLSNPFFDCGNIDDFWNLEELKEWFSNKNDVCAGAFIEGKLIGFCLTHLHAEVHKVHLENIFVIDEYRKQGIAHNLFDYMKNQYSKKLSNIRLIGLVNCSNKKALDFLVKEKLILGDKMIWTQLNI